MSILTKPRLLAQQRFDLEDFEVLLSSMAADAKFWTRHFWGPTQYILKGFNVSGLGGPSPANIVLDGSTLINANNSGEFSWFVGDVGASPLEAVLNPGTRNYIEVEISTEDGTPLTRAFWDPSAQGGLGAEFNQNVNTVTNLKVDVVVLTGGFSGSANRIRVAVVDTDGSNNIIGILDKRDLFFRKATPEDALEDFSWASRTEPELTLALTGVAGTFVAGETVSIGGSVTAEVQTGGSGPNIGVILHSGDSFAAGDTVTGADSGATGTLSTFSDSFTGADKSLQNLRDELRSLKTEIRVIKGTRFYFESGLGSITGINNFVNSAIVPASTANAPYIKWDGSKLSLLDADLTPSGSDIMARIRMWNNSNDLDLTRQDDGKEVVTLTPAEKPDAGAYVLDFDGNTVSIDFDDDTAAIQTAWDASAGVAATITGSLQDDRGVIITFDAAGSQVDIVEDSSTLTRGGGAVAVAISIKQGQASDTSIAIADGEVLYVELPATGARTYSDSGSGSTNYKVAALGSFVCNDTNYWLAYREGSTLIFRGVGEVQSGETSQIGDNIPQSLLNILGLASETSNPSYLSNIRGVAAESLVARLGVLTDAMGDAQEDRSGYLRSDSVVTWTGSEIQFSEDLILELINTKDGTLTQHTIAAANSPISVGNAESIYVKVKRDDASETLTLVNSGTTPIPAQTQLNKDVFVLFRRVDTASGLQMLHMPFHKQVLQPGQSVFLGASGSGGDDSGVGLEPVPGYNWLEMDDFSELPASSDSKVNDTLTNATHNIAKKLYQLSCDKSLTCTTTGASFTLSGDPGFTLQAGDIIYDNSSGEFRRVLNVSGTGPTAGTLDAGFTVDLAADSVMCAQAVWSKDLVNFGDASEKTRARDFFSGDILQTLIDYQDSLAAGDEVADLVDAARVVVSASNNGDVDDSGTPTSDLFNSIFTRPQAPATIENYALGTVDSTETVAEQTSNDTERAIVSSAVWYGNSFLPIYSGELDEATFRIKTTAGTITGNGFVRIYADNGSGLPDTGSILATSDNVDFSTLTGTYQDITFPFSTPIDLIKNTRYHAIVVMSGISGFGNVVFATQASSGYTDGRFIETIDTGASFQFAGGVDEDLYFSVTVTATLAGRLHLVFFPNPSNASVTTTANLLRYEANFYADESQINSGVLEDAICFSDDSTTAVGCTVSTPAGLTEVVLDWSYIPGVNAGQPSGQVEVYVDGKRISRYIGAAETPSTDLYWTEQPDSSGIYNTIQFNADLSAFAYEIVVIKRFGVYDMSDENSAKIAALHEIVIGSAAQVSAGIAHYTTLQDAHDAATEDQTIRGLTGGTYGALTSTKRLNWIMDGYGAQVGNITFDTGSDLSTWKGGRLTGTLDTVSDGSIISNFFIDDAANINAGSGTIQGNVIADFVEY